MAGLTDRGVGASLSRIKTRLTRSLTRELIPPSSPFLPETTDIALEEGMVINIEVALVGRGFGVIQIEHTMVLRRGGYDAIIHQPTELLTLG